MRHKVIVIVGPTAVGKTEVAIKLAKIFQLEIISGDSVAVYKGLDIGSAKPTLEEQQGIKHYMLDILEPGMDFSVYDFQRSVRAILDKNPLTIICGGTGLYIQSALFDYEFKATKRSEEFSKKYESLSNLELYQVLKEKDPLFDEKRIHPNNRKRVLRALEVLEDTGKSIMEYDNAKTPLYDYFIAYLTMDRERLYQRIDERVDKMLETGLLEEARSIYQRNQLVKGIGYRELFAYFKGEYSLDEAIHKIKLNSRHLAKRQETWFKNQLSSHIYQIEDKELTIKEIKKDIEEWLKQ